MFRNLLRWAKPQYRPCPQSGGNKRFRPSLEALEERTVLSTFYVVPANAPADNIANFHDLHSALSATAGQTVATIQIEPGAAPGGLVDHGTTPLPQILIIQGDPNYTPAVLPQLLRLDLSETTQKVDLVLNNLNLSSVLVSGANAQLSGNAISQSVMLKNSQAGLPADSVQSCQFHDGGSLYPYTLRIDGSDSAVVTGNTFSSAKTGDTAVQIVDSGGVTVANNTITLTAGANQDTGIEVQTNLRDAGADLHDNIIKTATTAGSGIVTRKTTGHQLTVKIQNNDLTQNFIGLYVLGDDAQLGSIDAGSPQGSTGGNNFQGFTPNMNGREAIQTQFAATGTVEAQFNKWSVFLPATVVAPASGTTIVTGGTISLAGLAKFAQLIGLPLAYPALGSSPEYGYPGWLAGAAAKAQPVGLSADLMPAGSAARVAFFKAFASAGYERVAQAHFGVGQDLGPAELTQLVNALDAGGAPALALAQALATELAG
jgi:hypothetical protein